MRGIKGSTRKQMSKCCIKCGIEWLPDLSNKAPKRALCVGCIEEWQKDWWVEYNKRNPMVKINTGRLQKYNQFKIENRKPHWKKINDELKKMQSRDEWLPYIQLQMENILNNKELMNYINDTDVS